MIPSPPRARPCLLWVQLGLVGRASILQVRTHGRSWNCLLEIAVTMVWYLVGVSPGLAYHLLSILCWVIAWMSGYRFCYGLLLPVTLKPYDASIGEKLTELSPSLDLPLSIVYSRHACIPAADFFFHGSETPGVASAVSAIQKGVIHGMKSPAEPCHC